MNCCKEYAQTISEYLDGALGESERVQLLEHLENCEGCRAYLAELAAMHDALGETPEAELPEGFHESVMEKAHAKARAKKLSVWKRYAAVAACAAIVLMGTVRLMPDFGAGSAVPEEAAGGADMAMMEEGALVAESPAAMENQSLTGGEARAVEDAVTEEAKYEYAAETEFFADAMPTETAEAEAGELPLPVIRGENVRETLLSLGATEDGELLLVPIGVAENLPEGLELVGEYDKTAELVSVLPEEVAK